MNLCLAELLDFKEPGFKFRGDAKPLSHEVMGVSIDSRSLKKGDLFFAIKGENFDGHDYAAEALTKGAIAAVVSHKWFNNYGDQIDRQNLLLVPDTLLALQELARYYRLKFKIPTIAITGSVGKTTVKEAVYAVLAKKYNLLRNKKSFNNHIGVPLTLLELSGKHEILLTEIGMNHPGEIDRLAYLVQPTHGMITNIAMAHLEFLGSLEGVAKAKMELFNHMPASGTAFINWDDETLRTQEFPVENIIRYGLSRDADVSGRIMDCDSNACYRVEVAGQEIQLRLPGRHNVYNALAAAAVGLEFQIPLRLLKEALQLFKPIEKRMQVFHLQKGIVLLDDSYNSNPTSCAAALSTLSDLKASAYANQFAVLGDMLELGSFTEIEHRQLGRLVAKMGFTGLFGFGEAMRIAVEEAHNLNVSTAIHFSDKTDLLASLVASISPGAQILVKGSRAMHMEDITEGLKKEFSTNVTA